MPWIMVSKSQKRYGILLMGFLLGALLLAIFLPLEIKLRARLYLSRYRKLTPYIIRLARLESGNYTSTNFRQLKNVFNIKNAEQRQGQPGHPYPGSEFRAYAFYFQSASDLISLFNYYGMVTTVEDSYDFVSELKSHGYFEEDLNYYFTKFEETK